MAFRVLAILLLVTVCGRGMKEMDQQENQYIITLPESTTVDLAVNQSSLWNNSESIIQYGKFQCATRAGFYPLWLINGRSPASIKNQSGFENISYKTYPLPVNGTFTLLYVPGSAETNNSRIRCAAVLVKNGVVMEYTEAVNFTVYASEIILPTDKGTEHTPIPPHLIAGITVTVLLTVVLTLSLVLLVLLSVWCVWTRRRAIDNNEATKENIYWSASSGNVLLNNTMNSGATKLEQEIHILSS